MTLDAHLHIWDRTRSAYAWLDGAPHEIAGSFSVDDGFAALGRFGVERAILVQADETLDETAFLLETAAQDPRIAGVVAYLPLHDAHEFERGWDLFGDHPCLAGIRNLTHDRADEDWNVRPDVLAGIAAVAERGLPLDYVAVTPRHLAHVPMIAARHPELTIVIDHLAKPPIGSADAWEGWRSGIERAAGFGNVVAKVSGVYGDDAPGATIADAVRTAIDAFGADRLMFGSDWPVIVTAGGPEHALPPLLGAITELSEAERAAVLGGTARRVYGIGA
ncbi:MAG TPA: amidohydrolase family protein [Microbacterium sp.]|nr:amidohydrolase family protein [Microbacterium sp.]